MPKTSGGTLAVIPNKINRVRRFPFDPVEGA